MSQVGTPRLEPTHHRLHDFAEAALLKIFIHPYATVCELYCGGGHDAERWTEAQIGHYIGIDEASSGISARREAWESLRKVYTSDFFELDPCTEDIEPHLQEKVNQANLVCCMHHLQLCFETEEKARMLLHNVASLLKPGGYFFGITPDSSTIWAKYQKNVEAYHSRSSSMKPGIVPNCVRSESYMITFEVEEEKFPLFGKRYQLKFAGDVSAETHCLVHFPSLIRLAREAGLEYVEIQNLTEFFDDNRFPFTFLLKYVKPETFTELSLLLLQKDCNLSTMTGMLMSQNLVDSRGRLLPRSFDVLGLYTTFVFQKPNPDAAPPLTTPIVPEVIYINDENEWNEWRDEEMQTSNSTEQVPGLGMITEQKGILGPGPVELRFPEAV